MSGHSKWSTIKRKKGATDAKRSKEFTKVIKEITVAARMGGGDPASNPRLRQAVQTARSVNMPADNVTRAIKRGTGELEGVTYEEITYEGYGPSGVAVLIHCLTDNRNRTVSEVRRLLTKYGGSLGETGCVNWMFERKGLIEVSTDGVDETKIMDIVLDLDVEDVTSTAEVHTVITHPDALDAVREGLEGAQLTVQSSKISYVPQNEVKLSGEGAEKVVNLLTFLEDHEDIQDVVSNFDVDETELAELMAEA